MIHRSKTVQTAGCADYLLYPRIAEFNYLSRFNINKMIVLAALVSSFKLGYVFTKLMFYHKIAVEKQFNRIVKCCPAHPVVFIFHEYIKRFNVKMTAP